MMKQNAELRAEARAALGGKWVMAAVATLVFTAVAGAASYIPLVGFILVALPLGYGYAMTLLDVVRGGNDVNIGTLFVGFNDFGRIVGTKLLKAIYTFLWSLLLVIPGIVKMYSYAMTDYILRDEPQLANNAAIEKSMSMMDGNKMKLFMLDLSFIGWAILCMFTLGIGYLFLQPYVEASHVAFYEDLKAQAAEKEF
ncbi:DUF975 family protein [Oscillospiraceae bacterium N12]|jgi:uncharacterized membrane protein|uniref:DUF975 family protein n=1 Tax=Jilunia laotingensis TaxID=2763675 RepID=A0A926F7E4_9BACT|nr:DUF975 family protein [Jilunia laotingensis]MBC8593229.1 DUF975 family protein [Jilunia laotingensis]